MTASWAQEVLRLAERMRPGTVLDPRCAVYRAWAFDDEPDLDTLARVVETLGGRHDALHAGPGPAVPLPPRPLRLQAERLPAGAGEDDVVTAVTRVAHAPYDLEAGPLGRVAWLAQGAGGVLVLALHHWAGDSAALDALAADLVLGYATALAGGPPPPPPPSYAALVARQRAPGGVDGDAVSTAAHWWRRELSGARRAALPPTGPAPTGGARALVTRPLDPAAHDALVGLAAAHRASPYMVFLAAFGALLDDGSGRADATDALVFTVDPGRRGDTGRVVGFLAEPLPLRLRLDHTASFPAAVAAARRTVLGALAHRTVPFLCLLEASPRLAVALLRGRRPGTLVQYVASSDVELGGRRGRPLPMLARADGDVGPHPAAVPIDLDLTLERRDGGHAVSVLFDPGLWDARGVAGAVLTAERLLVAARDTDAPLRTLLRDVR